MEVCIVCVLILTESGARHMYTSHSYVHCCRLKKLMYRVVFPFELKLGNTSDNCNAADSVYNLFAVVVHIGSGMNHGKPTFT